MTGWSRHNRRLNLHFPEGTVSFRVVSENEARNIGGFMLGLACFLFCALISAVIAVLDDGRLTAPALAEGTEYLSVIAYLWAFLTFTLAFRGALATVIMAIGFMYAVGLAREAMELQTMEALLLAFGVWWLALLGSFALLWPYPMWPGLVIAYLLCAMMPLALFVSWLDPGRDIAAVVALCVVTVFVTIFGIALRWQHRVQQDIEGRHFVRYGD